MLARLMGSVSFRGASKLNYGCHFFSTTGCFVSSPGLQQLVERHYPAFSSCKNRLNTVSSRLNPDKPLVSFGRSVRLVSGNREPREMFELPSGRRKEAYVFFGDKSTLWVLQLLKPVLLCELLQYEAELTHDVDPYLQPSQYLDPIIVLNSKGVVYETQAGFQRYVGPDWQTIMSSPYLTMGILKQLLVLLPDIAQQLIHVHQCGFRHGDVRLENMTVESVAGLMVRGHLIDYGLARRLPEESVHTNDLYHSTSPGDWSGFVKTIERILSTGLPMSPLVEETLLSYCAMVRTMIQRGESVSLNDPSKHHEYFKSIKDDSATDFYPRGFH